MELTPLVSGVHKLSRLGRFGRAAAHDDNFQARSSGCRLAAAETIPTAKGSGTKGLIHKLI